MDEPPEVKEEFPLKVIERDQCVFPPEAEQAIGEGIKRLISKKSTYQFKEFAENLFDEWGGPRQIARSMKHTYEQAPAGSMTRARILDRITSFMQSLSEDQAEEEFDDETIIAVMKEEMRRDGFDPKPTPPIRPAEIQLPGPAELPQHSDSRGDSGG